jgi:hypothetical protein
MSGAALTFSVDQQAHAEPAPIAAPHQQRLPRGLREGFAPHGYDVAFGDTAYEPASGWGRELIAHELASVVQQRGSTGGPSDPVEQAHGDNTALAATLGAVRGESGAGRPLSASVRATAELALCRPLDGVRVHRGPAAAAVARRFDARAFTVGEDVVLGESVPEPDSQDGMRALGHELAHVVQQRLGGSVPESAGSLEAEREAEDVGHALASARHSGPVTRGTAVGIARQPMDPRDTRGHTGEQSMGFTHYRAEDGWILFEGPDGAGGHGTTQSGLGAVAYNTRTGEIHRMDNQSHARTGNVGSAIVIDPERNPAKSLDGLIGRVEAAKDVRTPAAATGRVRLLRRLRSLRTSLEAGKPVERIGHERALAQVARKARLRAGASIDAQMRAPKVDPGLVEYNREMEENDRLILQDMYRAGFYVYVSRATNVDGLTVNRSGGMVEAIGPLSLPVLGIGDELRSVLQANGRALAGEDYVAPQEIVEIHDLNTPAAQSRRLGLDDVQNFAEFSRTYQFTQHTREGVELAFLRYHNQRSDRIVENWRRTDNAFRAVNLIAQGTLVGVQFIVDPVGAVAPLLIGYGTEKALTAAGFDPDTAAMGGHLAGSAVAVGKGLWTDPVGTGLSLVAADSTTLLLKAAGVSDQDAGLLGGAVGTTVGMGRTLTAMRRSPVQGILSARRASRAESDAQNLEALGRDFENSRGLRLSDDATLFRRLPPGARLARLADLAPNATEGPATPLALSSAPAPSGSEGLAPIPGTDYFSPGEYAVVPYEATATSRSLQRVFDGGLPPRSGLVAYASSGDGGFSGGGGRSSGTPRDPSDLATWRPGQLLLAAGRERGTLIDPVPSDDAIVLGPGRLGLERFGSRRMRIRAEPWINAVLSNRPFSWESIGLGWLGDQEKAVVRMRSLELGLVPRIPVDPLTRYADFSSVLVAEETLPEELWHLTDDEQFTYLNDQIGGKIPGTTWHHHELPGWMQLVAFGVHAITSHIGGRSPGHWASGDRE